MSQHKTTKWHCRIRENLHILKCLKAGWIYCWLIVGWCRGGGRSVRCRVNGVGNSRRPQASSFSCFFPTTSWGRGRRIHPPQSPRRQIRLHDASGIGSSHRPLATPSWHFLGPTMADPHVVVPVTSVAPTTSCSRPTTSRGSAAAADPPATGSATSAAPTARQTATKLCPAAPRR